MSEEITLKIDKFSYFKHNIVDRSFSNNKYGTWHVHIENDGRSFFKFLVVFVPAHPQTSDALKGLRINVAGLCTSRPKNRENPHTEYDFEQIGASPVYKLRFYAYQMAVDQSRNYSFDINIDVSSLATPTPSSSSHGLTGFTKKMLEKEKLADITIETEDGKKIYASRFILSRSPVFDAMLNNHDTKEAQESTIKINDIQHEVLKEMIRYMYTDKVPKLEEMALDLILVADKYDLPGLLEKCSMFLQSNINISNFAIIIDTADKVNATELKKKVIKFIIKNREEAFAADDWKTLKLRNVQLGMEVMEHLVTVLK